ncbi:kinase-like domain-containing protein [Mycena galopus ATCC 62051]|nr:kinase-like domain-containing protein [Mycena galopus ATCC 62051]
MAPELIDPDRFGCKFARTPATDVYAFGCVCFELYTGRPPFSHLPEPAALMKIIDGERPPRPSGPPTMANRLWQHVTEFWAEKHSTRPLSRFVVQKMRWPPESQTLRPLPLLPDTSLSRSPSPTTSATLPSSPTPSTILPDVSSPESLVLDQGLGVFDDVITPEEDLRRLFNDCMIGARNATVLGEALLVANPEQLNDSLIVEFYKKCIDSQEVISTQIQWATATAERNRVAADEPPSEAPLALTPGATFELTREEALLAELLAANEQLTETLKLYDDLERVAFEHLVEQRGRQDQRMNSRQRQYTTTAVTSQGGSPSPILPPSPAGSNSRSRDVTRDSFLDRSTPLTPAPPYVGWVAAAPALLQEFIDESVNPREFYYDLREIAHSQSGSVLAAALVPDAAIHRLELPPLLKARDREAITKGKRVLVALKCIALLPESSTRLFVLRRECELLRGLRCEQVLGIDAMYVDLVEDALWIRMELMERSLTGMISLIKEGLRLQDPRIVARLMSDILHALDYLQRHSIAHRDLRPDNLLLNSEGVLKVAHFSSAMRVTPEERLATDIVGFVHWQAPEVRSGSYDPLKIDVWSVGAILWQIAEVTPPFSDGKRPVERWPPVSKVYPPWLHDFLRLCSEPALSRPSPKELLETALVKRASGRSLITRLFSRFSSPEATHEPVAI